MSTNRPESPSIDGNGKRVGIVAARYNFDHVNSLLESVLSTLDQSGVQEEHVETFRVPGSNEIPHVVSMAAQTGDFDVLIALGVIIRGDTEHDRIIGHSTARSLAAVSLRHEIPVINGIVTVNSEQQAHERCSGDLDRGSEFAYAALEMAELNMTLAKRIMDNDMDEAMEDLDWLDELDDDDDDFSR
jgi:6,7-dimethyl-8-ribityllumazine synthase